MKLFQDPSTQPEYNLPVGICTQHNSCYRKYTTQVVIYSDLIASICKNLICMKLRLVRFELSEGRKSTVTFVASPLIRSRIFVSNMVVRFGVVHAYLYIIIYWIIIDPIL